MSRWDHGNVNWLSKLDGYALALVNSLGYDPYELQGLISRNRENPLVSALRSDPKRFVAACSEAANGGAPNLDGTSRAVVLCQMVLYDLQGGPEGDFKEKALRRHWYAYFKQFAQMFAFALGKVRPNDQGVDEMVDIQWSSRLSKVYSDFVDNGNVTYLDLWVEDASRMTDIIGRNDPLIPGINLVLAVEKDSLFGDFKGAARAVGAMALFSGKGKMSKAATEKALRLLGWTADSDPFDSGVSVITLSDYDYDGHGVIMPTFGEQMRRYVRQVFEERIGVQPNQVVESTDDAWNASYQIKVSNEGYRRWADENALFWGECSNCGHEQFTVGLSEVEMGERLEKGKLVKYPVSGIGSDGCAVCDNEIIVTSGEIEEPHGYEVESLRSADYYRAIVRAILRLFRLDFILERMRAFIAPSKYGIQNRMVEERLENNERYQKIQKAIDRLGEAQQQLRENIEGELDNEISETINSTADEWQALGDDPTEEDFEDYVVNQAASSWATVWRPFSQEDRNRFIIDRLNEDTELIETIDSLDIEDFGDVVDEVVAILTE